MTDEPIIVGSVWAEIVRRFDRASQRAVDVAGRRTIEVVSVDQAGTGERVTHRTLTTHKGTPVTRIIERSTDASMFRYRYTNHLEGEHQTWQHNDEAAVSAPQSSDATNVVQLSLYRPKDR